MKLVNDRSTRKVYDHEITPYQGTGDKQAEQRAQSRKRRQVRAQEPDQELDVMGVILWLSIIGTFGGMFIFTISTVL